jgi:hypothetical protein
MTGLEGNAREIALNLLPQFHTTSERQHQIILQVIRSSLYDPNPFMRTAAAEARRRLDDGDAELDLQSAINAEADEMVRHTMQDYLHDLQRRKAAKELI